MRKEKVGRHSNFRKISSILKRRKGYDRVVKGDCPSGGEKMGRNLFEEQVGSILHAEGKDRPVPV